MSIGLCPRCLKTTGGDHEPHCPEHPDNVWPKPLAAGVGWQCPVCGNVNAPWVAQCPGVHGYSVASNTFHIVPGGGKLE